ncbi:hypothetical protein ABE237_22500 [Brevibacillus formosus]|uniref:hypothetical protein n=1 Tax=Brevibacillus formosus TaxID=54913 RepID=UPI0018CF7832|nr:hypothetical protein [Brevibacillus formosus]
MGIQNQVRKILEQRKSTLKNTELKPCREQPSLEATALQDQFETIDSRARAFGWISLQPGAAYEQSVSRHAKVYLFLEGENKWEVWRGTWRNGESKPFSEKLLGEGLTFTAAMYRGNDYVQWARKNRTEK